MTPTILLALIIALPIILAVVLRINGAVLFMSLCVGEVLVQFVAGNASSFASAVSPTGDVGSSTTRLVLLLLPVVLTAIFMFHSVHGSTKTTLNIIPAIGVGLLLAILIEPLLSKGTRGSFQHSSVWHQLSSAQTLIVSAGALFSLVFLWLHRHGGGKDHHHRAHKH